MPALGAVVSDAAPDFQEWDPAATLPVRLERAGETLMTSANCYSVSSVVNAAASPPLAGMLGIAFSVQIMGAAQRRNLRNTR